MVSSITPEDFVKCWVKYMIMDGSDIDLYGNIKSTVLSEGFNQTLCQFYFDFEDGWSKEDISLIKKIIAPRFCTLLGLDKKAFEFTTENAGYVVKIHVSIVLGMDTTLKTT